MIRVEGEGDCSVWIFTITLLVRLRGLMHTGIDESHLNLIENRGARPYATDIFYSWSLRVTVRHVLGVLMLASRMPLVRGG